MLPPCVAIPFQGVYLYQWDDLPMFSDRTFRLSVTAPDIERDAEVRRIAIGSGQRAFRAFRGNLQETVYETGGFHDLLLERKLIGGCE
jgi:hypothetical protein